MTNEEAVEKLKILKEDYWDDDGYGHESKLYDDTALALDMAIEALKERKTGKWVMHREDIVYTNGYLTKNEVVCSECGGEAFFDSETGLEKTPYCPHCGAKMEGGD